jgi:hypothetical protein
MSKGRQKEMGLGPKAKADLLQARQLKIEPYQKDGRVLVRTSRIAATYRVLVDATGALTQAGTHWEDATGEPLLSKKRKGHTFSADQETVKKGASETIALRNGSSAVVRSWDGSKYKYTATGKRYYKKREKNTLSRSPCEFMATALQPSGGGHAAELRSTQDRHTCP